MTEHSLPSPIVEVPESVADLPTSLEELALPSLFLFPTTHHQTSESRRGSQTQSLTGIMPFYGGLPPPSERLTNPRRGSVTGSYTLPVPPDWYRRSGKQLITTGVLPWPGRDAPVGDKKNIIAQKQCKAITTSMMTTSSLKGTVSSQKIEKYLALNSVIKNLKKSPLRNGGRTFPIYSAMNLVTSVIYCKLS